MRIFGSLVLVGLFLAAPALAQRLLPAFVGRLALASGTVAYRMAGETVWSAAALNYPVAPGASLWTEHHARAEIRAGPDTIDMAGGTALDIVRLEAGVTRLMLPEGRIDLHLRRLGAGQSFEVDIPRGTVRLLAPGIYDIAAGSETEPARVAVFSGRAHFAGGGADLGIGRGIIGRGIIGRGMAALLEGFDPVTSLLAQAEPDSFVAWCRAHDIDAAKRVAPHYVSREMTGYAELDRYGHWAKIPGYGMVWFPNAVVPGWVPYRDGRWIWVEPWGWTWVDSAPWGFAPTHYGRWAVIHGAGHGAGHGAWGWVPGRPVPRPVYAPALVAFIEGFYERDQPLIAWFPLAPGEVYWPSYARDIAYIRELNAPALRDANIALGPNRRPSRQVFATRYVNQRFATLVPERAFASARNSGKAVLRIAPARLERVPATFAPPAVHPVIARPLPPPPVHRTVLPPIGRKAPHPTGPIVTTAPPTSPAPALPKPAVPVHPLPPNAAMLPPLPPKQPQPPARPMAHSAAHGPAVSSRGAKPRNVATIAPPRRRETSPMARRRRPSRHRIAHRSAPHPFAPATTAPRAPRPHAG